MASRAIPSHLKPSAAEGGEGGFSSQRHHGKSQSHVVRLSPILQHHQGGFFGSYSDGLDSFEVEEFSMHHAVCPWHHDLFCEGREDPMVCSGHSSAQYPDHHGRHVHATPPCSAPIYFFNANITAHVLTHVSLRLSRTPPPMLPPRKCAMPSTSSPIPSRTPPRRRLVHNFLQPHPIPRLPT
jgi:hypothetical protein